MADGGTLEHFGAAQERDFRRTEDIINTPFIKRGVARFTSQITIVLQDITVSLAIMLEIIGKDVGLILRAHIEIKISGNKNDLVLIMFNRPIDDVANKDAS